MPAHTKRKRKRKRKKWPEPIGLGEARRHTMRQTAKYLADLHDTLQSLEAQHGCWFNVADTAHHKAITLLYEIANNLDSEITDINTRLANLETQETQG